VKLDWVRGLKLRLYTEGKGAEHGVPSLAVVAAWHKYVTILMDSSSSRPPDLVLTYWTCDLPPLYNAWVS
jgi:hypothetical protein